MPRPTDPTRAAAAISAARDLLGSVGYDGFTMADVATRVGGSKATLYRRWPSKVQLVISALDHASEPAPAVTGNLREDLYSLAKLRAASADIPVLMGVLWAMRTHTDLAAAVHAQVLQRRGREFHRVLQAARDHGQINQIPDNWEAVADILPSSIMYWFAVGIPVDQERIRTLIDTVIVPLTTGL